MDTDVIAAAAEEFLNVPRYRAHFFGWKLSHWHAVLTAHGVLLGEEEEELGAPSGLLTMETYML